MYLGCDLTLESGYIRFHDTELLREKLLNSAPMAEIKYDDLIKDPKPYVPAMVINPLMKYPAFHLDMTFAKLRKSYKVSLYKLYWLYFEPAKMSVDNFDFINVSSFSKLNLATNVNIIDLLETEFHYYDLIQSNMITNLANTFMDYDISIAIMKKLKQGVDKFTVPTIRVPYLLDFCNKIKYRSLAARGNPIITIEESYMSGNVIFEFHNLGDLLLLRKTFKLDGKDYKYAYLFDRPHFDYLIYAMHVRLNFDLIKAVGEYDFCLIFEDLIAILNKRDWKYAVSFMKSFETICLQYSDFCVFPNLPTISLDMMLSDFGLKIEEPGILKELFNWIESKSKDNKLTDVYVLASLHKFYYLSEVDEVLGVKKLIRRVMTPRSIEPEFVSLMNGRLRKEFLISYYQRHKTLPSMSPDSSEKMNALLNNNITVDSLRTINDLFFSDIKFEKCIDLNNKLDVLQLVKDKSCLKNEVCYTVGKDSGSEIREVANDPKYYDVDLKKIINEMRDAPFRNRQFKIQSETKGTLEVLCAKASNKEKEQKEEGRLFTMNQLRFKHAISWIMDSCKKILSYYDGEYMTISSDKRRSEMLAAADLLKSKNTYSILLDIEGHNQSMQNNNTNFVWLFIGEILGIDLGFMSDLFRKYKFYYPMHFIDASISWEGQYGGTEGWFNPVWTLHTLIQSKLLDTNDIILKKTLCYSDDVCLIVEIDDLNNINETFRKIKDHFAKGGMTVKIEQTAVSKNRVTLLRKHYHYGLVSDMTPKKLLSSSTMNEVFMSNQLDMAALNSTITSALEYSNNIKTAIYIKWFHATIIGFKAFENSIYRSKHLDNKEYFEGLSPFSKKIISTLSKSKGNNIIFSESLINTLKSVGYDNLFSYHLNEEMPKMQKKALIKMMIQYDKTLQNIFFFFLITPVSSSGLGLNLLVTQTLSGGSPGYYTTMSYAKNLVKLGLMPEKVFSKVISSNLRHKPELISVITDEFLTNDPYPSHQSVIKGYIKSELKNIKNEFLISFLKEDSQHTNLRNNIYNAFKSSMHVRLTSFMLERSSIGLTTYLINKFCDSRSFIKSLSKSHSLQSSIMTMNSNLFNNFYCPTQSRVDWSQGFIKKLFQRRRAIYPQVNFIDITELTYDDELIYNDCTKDPIYCIYRETDKKFYRDTTPMLHRSKGATMKLDDDQSKSYSSDKRVKMAYENIILYKWLCNKDFDMNSLKNLKALITLLNLSLGLEISVINFMFANINPPLGGEIWHRLNNLNFKSSVAFTALPNIANLSQPFMMYANYTKKMDDSNIHFEYVRMRFCQRYSLRSYFSGLMPYREEVAFNNDLFYCSVTERFKIMEVQEFKIHAPPILTPLNMQLLKVLETEMTGISFSLKGEDITSHTLNTISAAIIRRYCKLLDELKGTYDSVFHVLLWLDLKKHYNYLKQPIDFITYRNRVIGDFLAKTDSISVTLDEVLSELYHNLKQELTKANFKIALCIKKYLIIRVTHLGLVFDLETTLANMDMDPNFDATEISLKYLNIKKFTQNVLQVFITTCLKKMKVKDHMINFKSKLPITGSNLIENREIYLKYNFVRISEDVEDFKNKMHKVEKVWKLYCNPIMWQSETGSESFGSSFLISKMLKYKYPELNVLNLASGRGDTDAALNTLKIKHTSLSRLSFYNIRYLHSKTIYIDYDAFDISSWSKFIYDDRTIILIDISFVQVKVNQLKEFILRMLESNYRFIIRGNSLIKHHTLFESYLDVIYNNHPESQTKHFYYTNLYDLNLPVTIMQFKYKGDIAAKLPLKLTYYKLEYNQMILDIVCFMMSNLEGHTNLISSYRKWNQLMIIVEENSKLSDEDYQNYCMKLGKNKKKKYDNLNINLYSGQGNPRFVHKGMKNAYELLKLCDNNESLLNMLMIIENNKNMYELYTCIILRKLGFSYQELINYSRYSVSKGVYEFWGARLQGLVTVMSQLIFCDLSKLYIRGFIRSPIPDAFQLEMSERKYQWKDKDLLIEDIDTEANFDWGEVMAGVFGFKKVNKVNPINIMPFMNNLAFEINEDEAEIVDTIYNGKPAKRLVNPDVEAPDPYMYKNAKGILFIDFMEFRADMNANPDLGMNYGDDDGGFSEGSFVDKTSKNSYSEISREEFTNGIKDSKISERQLEEELELKALSDKSEGRDLSRELFTDNLYMNIYSYKDIH